MDYLKNVEIFIGLVFLFLSSSSLFIEEKMRHKAWITFPRNARWGEV